MGRDVRVAVARLEVGVRRRTRRDPVRVISLAGMRRRTTSKDNETNEINETGRRAHECMRFSHLGPTNFFSIMS